jgi:membrane fusion protein, heavy metal efflux system
MATASAIPDQDLVDSRNAEAKSRLLLRTTRRRLLSTARQRLVVMGVSETEIDDLMHPNAKDMTDKAKMIRRAPADGVVIKRDVVPGNLYDRNDTLLTIAQGDSLWVFASINERDLHKVKVGQNMTVRFPFDGGSMKAKVEHIGPQIDRERHTVKIRTSVPNPDQRIKAGMLVRMELETDGRLGSTDLAPPPSEESPVATTRDRLSELERKLDRLLEERTSHASIIERLDALERKLDRLLDGRR